MHFDFTPAVILLAVIVCACSWLGIHGLRQRSHPASLAFAVTAFLVALWSGCNAFELVASEVGTKLLWSNLQYVSIVSVPMTALIMILDYTGQRHRIGPRYLAAFAILPVITLVLVWTNRYHSLMHADVWLRLDGTYPALAIEYGPWFWVHTAYCYMAALASIAFLVRSIRRTPPLYRDQPIALLVGLCLPLAWNMAYVLLPSIMPLHNFTPAIFGAAVIVAGWGLFRFCLFTLGPAARHNLFENMADGLVVLDDRDRVVDVNEAARRIIGQGSSAMLARPLSESWDQWPQIATTSSTETAVAKISCGDNDKRKDYEVKISGLVKDQEILGRLLVIRDVTERTLLEETLRQQALTDGMTGLANRNLLMSKLEDSVRRARRNAGAIFSLISLDLDRFKLINDNVGHLAGDFLLKNVARKLTFCVREVDTVARMGGDEFMILLHEIGSVRDVLMVVDRIQEELHEPVLFRQHELSSSASLGVVIWDGSYEGADDLLRAADTAMYQAKEAGRGCYRIFDEQMHQSVLRTLEAEAELRAAIKSRDFYLVYQPTVDFKTGAISSLEGLIRWRHPKRGTVFPGEFIGIAESCGLIAQLDSLMLEEALSQLRHWNRAEESTISLPISLNLSPKRLMDKDFLDTLRRRMADWRISPQSLIIEFTESALIRDPARSKQVMDEIRKTGIRLCLDDFGSGWSSLQHLATFPVQQLKIDRTLVSRIAPGNTESEIARSITSLAHALGLTVIGEGLERCEQWGLLEELGCDGAQGFYIARPMTPNELMDYLRELEQGCCPLPMPVGHQSVKHRLSLPRKHGQETSAPSRAQTGWA